MARSLGSMSNWLLQPRLHRDEVLSTGEATFHHILAMDPHASASWRELGPGNRADMVSRLRCIDGVVAHRGAALMRQHAVAHEALSRFFVTVQQRDFEYGRLGRDWEQFLADGPEQLALFARGLRALRACNLGRARERILRIYGSVKPQISLEAKRGTRRHFDALSAKSYDIWDCVRYRIVAEDVVAVSDVAIALWRDFFDRVAYARNYWFYPKGGDPANPYRAIHLVLALEPGRVAEVQIITAAREIGGLMDHSVFFKPTHVLAPTQEKWLRAFLLKINIADAAKCYLSESCASVPPGP